MTDAEIEEIKRTALAEAATAVVPLVLKARKLVEMLDDAEVNHGGLWAGKTMRARDELRQELFLWRNAK